MSERREGRGLEREWRHRATESAGWATVPTRTWSVGWSRWGLGQPRLRIHRVKGRAGLEIQASIPQAMAAAEHDDDGPQQAVRRRNDGPGFAAGPVVRESISHRSDRQPSPEQRSSLCTPPQGDEVPASHEQQSHGPQSRRSAGLRAGPRRGWRGCRWQESVPRRCREDVGSECREAGLGGVPDVALAVEASAHRGARRSRDGDVRRPSPRSSTR